MGCHSCLFTSLVDHVCVYRRDNDILNVQWCEHKSNDKHIIPNNNKTCLKKQTNKQNPAYPFCEESGDKYDLVFSFFLFCSIYFFPTLSLLGTQSRTRLHTYTSSTRTLIHMHSDFFSFHNPFSLFFHFLPSCPRQHQPSRTLTAVRRDNEAGPGLQRAGLSSFGPHSSRDSPGRPRASLSSFGPHSSRHSPWRPAAVPLSPERWRSGHWWC